MSIAVGSTVIKYNVKSGVYVPKIESPMGDIVQYYTGSESNLGKIYIDIEKIAEETNKPLLYLDVVSSRSAEQQVKFASDVEIYVNGTKLAFDSNGLSTTMFGDGQNEHFKAVKNSTGTGAVVYGIRLMRNLIKDFNFTSINIKMVGKIQYGTQLDSVQATYTIPVQKYSGNGYAVTIKAGDSKGFTIRERGTEGAVTLVASVWDIEAGTETTGNLKYVWEKAVPTESGWADLNNDSKTLKVDDTMIAAYGEFRCTVSQGTTLLGSDMRSVNDATDEYVVNLHPTPPDETINEGSGEGVKYEPKLAIRTATGTNEVEGYKFGFSVKDGSGVPLNKYQDGNGQTETSVEMATTPQTSYTVTEAQCIQAGGDVSLTVFAVKAS